MLILHKHECVYPANTKTVEARGIFDRIEFVNA